MRVHSMLATTKVQCQVPNVGEQVARAVPELFAASRTRCYSEFRSIMISNDLHICMIMHGDVMRC